MYCSESQDSPKKSLSRVSQKKIDKIYIPVSYTHLDVYKRQGVLNVETADSQKARYKTPKSEATDVEWVRMFLVRFIASVSPNLLYSSHRLGRFCSLNVRALYNALGIGDSRQISQDTVVIVISLTSALSQWTKTCSWFYSAYIGSDTENITNAEGLVMYEATRLGVGQR